MKKTEEAGLGVFHMLPTGGGARLAAQNIEHLSGRHSITIHGVEGAVTLPVPGNVRVHVHPFPRGKPLRGAARFFAPWLLQVRLRAFREVCRGVAAAMNAGCGGALVHNSMVIAAPPVLDYLSVPSLYFCYEYPRHLYEKGCINRTGSRLGDLLLAPLERAERREDAASMKRADRVATFSPYMQGRLMDIYAVRAGTVFPGVDSRFFCPGSPGRSRGHLLSVGALWPFKGHDSAILATARLPQRSRPRLVIAADREFPGYGAALLRQASRQGVDLSIHRAVSDTDLRELYRGAAAVLCFQRNEPYGLVPLEAMACGRPVIARNSGGFADNLVHGVNGLLVDEPIPEASEVLGVLLSDRGMAQRLGSAGRDFVTEHRTPELSARRLEALLPVGPLP